MNTKESIISKIKKCLAKGDHTRNSSEAEVQVALAMAHRLMAEHNIAMTEVQFDKEHGTLKEDIKGTDFGEIKSSPWRSHLVKVVDIICNTKHYFKIEWSKKNYRKKIRILCFVGCPSDIEMAILIYKELFKAIKGLQRGYTGHQQSFAYGIVCRLLDRAREMTKTIVNPANTNALIVVKGQAINQFMATLGLSAGRKSSSRLAQSDYAAGYSAGGNVPLGRNNLRLSYK